MRLQAALMLLACAALAGCGRSLTGQLKDIEPPSVVAMEVERTIPLPAWATAPLPNTPPANGTVEALVKANDARAATIDYANCRSRLIERVQAGEKVDRKECER